MAGPFDFFTPGPWTDPNEQPLGAAVSGFLADPRGRAALLQMGLQGMSPATWGDTTMGQVARAVGSGGEATTRGEAMDIKAQEAASKQDLRAATADAATARAGQAGANADIARTRLGIAEQDLARKREAMTTSARIRLSNMYQQHLRDIAKENANPLRTGPPIEAPTMEQWIRKNPTLRDMGLVPDQGAAPEDTGTTTTAPPTTPTTSPPAPPNPADRTAGTVYATPRGDLKWTGTGWVNP
jgi:hypothetical protein